MGKEPGKTFSQRRHSNANSCKKRYSTSLIMREIKNKTTMTYYLSPVGMVVIKKMRQHVLVRMRRKGNSVHCWWECEVIQALWKTVGNFLKNSKWSYQMTQYSHFCVYIQEKKWNHHLREIEEMTSPPCSLRYYLQSPKQKQPACSLKLHG